MQRKQVCPHSNKISYTLYIFQHCIFTLISQINQFYQKSFGETNYFQGVLTSNHNI